MKEADIKPTIAKLTASIDVLNRERDMLTEKIRELSNARATLEEGQKLLDTATPSSPIRAHVLEALGIESSEQVNGQ